MSKESCHAWRSACRLHASDSAFQPRLTPVSPEPPARMGQLWNNKTTIYVLSRTLLGWPAAPEDRIWHEVALFKGSVRFCCEVGSHL